jgi:hypothetical protein
VSTCKRIVRWRQNLAFPAEANVSPAARDLIRRLICDAEHRLTVRRGFEMVLSDACQNRPIVTRAHAPRCSTSSSWRTRSSTA